MAKLDFLLGGAFRQGPTIDLLTIVEMPWSERGQLALPRLPPDSAASAERLPFEDLPRDWPGEPRRGHTELAAPMVKGERTRQAFERLTVQAKAAQTKSVGRDRVVREMQEAGGTESPAGGGGGASGPGAGGGGDRVISRHARDTRRDVVPGRCAVGCQLGRRQ